MLTTYTPKATVSLGAEAEHAHRQHKDSGQRAKDGWHHCRSEIPEGVCSAQGSVQRTAGTTAGQRSQRACGQLRAS